MRADAAEGLVLESRQHRRRRRTGWACNRRGFPRVQLCVSCIKDGQFGGISEPLERDTPRKARCFAGGRSSVPCPVGAARRGPGGAHPPAGQRCRPLPAVHRDAYCGAGRGDGGGGCAGPDGERCPGFRGPCGRPPLASQVVYTPPSKRLPGLASDSPIQSGSRWFLPLLGLVFGRISPGLSADSERVP